MPGRDVVVTGAASGMGAATAAILTDLGARVTALDVRPTAIPVDRALEVDLRDRVSVERAAESIELGHHYRWIMTPITSGRGVAAGPQPPTYDQPNYRVSHGGIRARPERNGNPFAGHILAAGMAAPC